MLDALHGDALEKWCPRPGAGPCHGKLGSIWEYRFQAKAEMSAGDKPLRIFQAPSSWRTFMLGRYLVPWSERLYGGWSRLREAVPAAGPRLRLHLGLRLCKRKRALRSFLLDALGGAGGAAKKVKEAMVSRHGAQNAFVLSSRSEDRMVRIQARGSSQHIGSSMERGRGWRGDAVEAASTDYT